LKTDLVYEQIENKASANFRKLSMRGCSPFALVRNATDRKSFDLAHIGLADIAGGKSSANLRRS
tara:strand:+ start:407 stop:598 length:192 start_codon:yes stop_codon:yes gene_type:complete